MDKVNIVNMNELDMISAEVKELFDDGDISIGSLLTTLAKEFGSSATLEQVYDIYTNYKLPHKIVDGFTYVAGYRGTDRIPDGWHDNAKLIDVKQSGKECKLMFAVLNKFIYQTLSEFTLNEVVVFAKDIGSVYKICVLSEKIPATGEWHAVVDKSEKV